MIISVIIPVCNEKDIIKKNLLFLKKTSSKSQIEIIVVDGGSDDNTVELAKKYADIVLVSDRKSRAMQMHHGALAASGRILLFLHIDTILPENWVSCLLSAWENNVSMPKATAFHLKFDKGGWPYNLISWAAKIRYLSTGIPHGDQAIAIHQDTYFKYGGFPDVPFMEEYALFKRIKDNNRIIWLSKHVKASCRRYEGRHPLMLALRNSLLVLLYYVGLSPHTLARFYR
ncbi:MAG: TIGR04283 family arsenosugar biosynthesis glycosyltransferase [Candidatus Anammoxibacter sp.]